MAVELYPQDDRSPVGPGMLSRRVFGAPASSWTTPVFTEWELTGAEWVDEHPYDEFNFVLEGELHVESDGTVVVARTGDLVRVRAGSTGTYSAPGHARMLAVYDHNPDGGDSTIVGLSPVGSDGTDG
jgi:uncharacterized cupin superfamily protein